MDSIEWNEDTLKDEFMHNRKKRSKLKLVWIMDRFKYSDE